MRYMVYLGTFMGMKKWDCFNDTETKMKYEKLGFIVVDTESWVF